MSKVLETPAVNTPAVSPSADGTGVPASPADGSVVASPATTPAISWETAPNQLRTEYENTKAEAARLKAEAERWGQLGNYDQVSQLQSAFSQKLQTATTIGKTLGYTEDQIRTAMMEDPKGTLQYLQQEYAKPVTPTHQDLDQRLQSMLNERIAPIQERFDETINREANVRYEGERDRLFKSEFGDGLPDENREELFEILDSLVAADSAALSRLKFQNQVSDVARHWTQAKTLFMKRHNAYIAHERGKVPTVPGTKKTEAPQGKFADRKLSVGGTVKDLLNI